MCLMLWCNAWGAPCARVSPLWSVRSTPRSLVVPTCTPCSWGLVRTHNAHSEKHCGWLRLCKISHWARDPPGEGVASSSKPGRGREPILFPQEDCPAHRAHIGTHCSGAPAHSIEVSSSNRCRRAPMLEAMSRHACPSAIQSPPQIACQSPLVPLCCVLILLARCGAAGSLRRK